MYLYFDWDTETMGGIQKKRKSIKFFVSNKIFHRNRLNKVHSENTLVFHCSILTQCRTESDVEHDSRDAGGSCTLTLMVLQDGQRIYIICISWKEKKQLSYNWFCWFGWFHKGERKEEICCFTTFKGHWETFHFQDILLKVWTVRTRQNNTSFVHCFSDFKSRQWQTKTPQICSFLII